MVLKIELNELQIDRLSEILGNLSLVVFASVILPVITAAETFDIQTTILGIIAMTGCLIISISLLKDEWP
ncbi:hypothetical protein HY950_03605 [Candidatus Gottesmanbacteria bacterium]|nr:hypothetical protein [Candidatus Gottesmanbacteria bacterium]